VQNVVPEVDQVYRVAIEPGDLEGESMRREIEEHVVNRQRAFFQQSMLPRSKSIQGFRSLKLSQSTGQLIRTQARQNQLYCANNL
jgi:hypothetical protein